MWNNHRGSHDVRGGNELYLMWTMSHCHWVLWQVRQNSLGYFWKTAVQVPTLNFGGDQQWLGHDCHCRPLVFLGVHISEGAYQVQSSLWYAARLVFTHPAIQPLFIQQILPNSSAHLYFSSKPWELRNSLYISKIATCISESWLLYWGQPHRKLGSCKILESWVGGKLLSTGTLISEFCGKQQ